MNLIAIFKKDRAKPGVMQVWHEGAMVNSFPCLGKSDNATAAKKGNPSRNPERQYGDTPTGTWSVRIGIKKKNTRTYGVHCVLMMWPISGQALRAYAAPGKRSGIWIHGGAPNDAGNLRPTYGCIRLFDHHMATLHELLKQYGQTQTTLETKEEES